MKNNKTFWQKIYSALGFWFYYKYINHTNYRVFYWCCLPCGKFFRKFDLFKVKADMVNKNPIEIFNNINYWTDN